VRCPDRIRTVASRATSGIVCASIILKRPMKTISVARRFCGPASSANGGYFAGLVATLASDTLAVRLMKPPPLNTELEIVERSDGAFEVRHGDALVGEAKHAELRLELPLAVSYFEAVEASRRYTGFLAHRFPTCFVCGTQRTRGDGMRIFAGPIPERAVVAAPWVPDASLDRGDGKVRPEFMSAALDCPGYYALTADDRMMVLAEFTVHLDRLVHIDESCAVVGWRMSDDGRKHEAGTAIFDEDGEVCGRARALWIEPRTPAA
jgi:hypothetical protein